MRGFLASVDDLDERQPRRGATQSSATEFQQTVSTRFATLCLPAGSGETSNAAAMVLPGSAPDSMRSGGRGDSLTPASRSDLHAMAIVETCAHRVEPSVAPLRHAHCGRPFAVLGEVMDPRHGTNPNQPKYQIAPDLAP